MALIEHSASPLVAKLKGLHLFHFEGAPCAQRVRFALAEKGFLRGREACWDSDEPDTLVADPGTWTSRHVSLIKKQHLTDAYAAIQPNMVVPALVHDGRLHIESMDIVDYVDGLGPDPSLLPSDPAQAGQARELVERGKAAHVSIRYVTFHWGLGRLGKLNAREVSKLAGLEPEASPEALTGFYSRFSRNQIDESEFRGHLIKLEDLFEELNALLTDDGRPYLVGETLSIADIIWSIKLLRLQECGYPFTENYPALGRWYRRVAASHGFQDGVMAKNRAMNRAFRMKAAIENFFGVGLAKASASLRESRVSR